MCALGTCWFEVFAGEMAVQEVGAAKGSHEFWECSLFKLFETAFHVEMVKV